MTLTGGKRKINKSLKAWVTFVKKVQKEEKLSYKDAIHRAKQRKDKGEKWMTGGNEKTPDTYQSNTDLNNINTALSETEYMEEGNLNTDDIEGGRRRRRRTMRRSRGRGRSARRSRGRASRRH